MHLNETVAIGYAFLLLLFFLFVFFFVVVPCGKRGRKSVAIVF